MDEKHLTENKKIENTTYEKRDGYSVANYDANYNTWKEESLENIFDRIDKLEQKWSHLLNELKNDIRTKMK